MTSDQLLDGCDAAGACLESLFESPADFPPEGFLSSFGGLFSSMATADDVTAWLFGLWVTSSETAHDGEEKLESAAGGDAHVSIAQRPSARTMLASARTTVLWDVRFMANVQFAREFARRLPAKAFSGPKTP